MNDYAAFLARKSQVGQDSGFEPAWVPDFLFDFQRALVEWACRKGRAAIFADCGLGKTPMQLVWAENVIRATAKPVLILTPLAVSAQTCREATKFDIDATVSRNGTLGRNITVTNYERLHYFDPSDFAGVVCDESSAIKAFDGKRRKAVTRFLSSVPYRLLCTATAAPNDYVELGTASEALGVLTQSEMLAMFFKSSDNQRHSLFREGDFWNRDKWFFRPHATLPFWRWVCSWARALRSPSDLGFDDDRFRLPDAQITQHVVDAAYIPPGELFPRVAATLKDQRIERKQTLEERCGRVADLVRDDQCAVVWCQYNAEGDRLAQLIPGAVQVAGADTDEDKEERLNAFTLGQIRVLVTKPKIGAWGLNWQHCGHQTFFPSHSFEQYYQAVRRSLRFGRTAPVWMDIRSGNLLPYKDAKENDEEKHVCPLQLDVITRCLTLWSNPGDTLLTPFMGVGSEVCGALQNGRKALGIELKSTYYRQAVKNAAEVSRAGFGCVAQPSLEFGTSTPEQSLENMDEDGEGDFEEATA